MRGARRIELHFERRAKWYSQLLPARRVVALPLGHTPYKNFLPKPYLGGVKPYFDGVVPRMYLSKGEYTRHVQHGASRTVNGYHSTKSISDDPWINMHLLAIGSIY